MRARSAARVSLLGATLLHLLLPPVLAAQRLTAEPLGGWLADPGEAPRPSPPTRDPSPPAGELAIGFGALTGAVVGGLLLGGLGVSLERGLSRECYDWCGLAGGLLGALAGTTLGAPLGAHYLADDGRGDLRAGLQLSLLAGVSGLLVGAVTDQSVFLLIPVAQILAATAAEHRTGAALPPDR